MPGHLNHCVVTLTGTTNVLNLGTLVAAILPIAPSTTVLNLQIQPLGANAGIVYVGGRDTLTTTNYGMRLEIPVSTIPQAPYMVPGGDRSGPAINLDDVYLIGTNNDKVSVFWQQSL